MRNNARNLIFILISFGIILPIFGYAAYSPSVQIKANSYDSPVTVSYNTAVELTWSSTNSTSCEASGDWSGTKAISGTETINNVTSSKNYIITCTGTGGSASAKMVINITNIPTSLSISKLVRNVTDGTAYLDATSANPGEIVSFQIQILAGNAGLQSVIVTDTLPNRVIYLGNLQINGAPASGNITSSLNIGDLYANQTRTITFDAKIADSNQFSSGITTLINSALAYNTLLSNSDTAKIIVSGGTGVPTNVPTGLTNNLFVDSFFLPLVMATLIIWVFKAHIVNFEKWVDLRKKEYDEYKARKILQIKIAEIKTKEFFRNRK
jgi:uncharacterized repeat protein (TIGR01451 family)